MTVATSTRVVPQSSEGSEDRSEVQPRFRIGRLGRLLIGGAAASVVTVGAIGLLHLPVARPLLRMIFPAATCPLTRGSPEQIDRAHDLGAAAIRSNATTSAPARPALGFELDGLQKPELLAWAARNQVSCSAIGGNDSLQRCADVPTAAVGDVPGPRFEEVSFEFDARGRVVSVQTMRRHLSADDAAALAARREQQLAQVLGPPTTTGGEATAGHLSHGVLNTYVAEHVFADYRATVSATKLASTGVMVREQYLSARP